MAGTIGFIVLVYVGCSLLLPDPVQPAAKHDSSSSGASWAVLLLANAALAVMLASRTNWAKRLKCRVFGASKLMDRLRPGLERGWMFLLVAALSAVDGFESSTLVYLGIAIFMIAAPLLSGPDTCPVPGADARPQRRQSALLWAAGAVLVGVPMAISFGRHAWVMAFVLPAATFF